MSHSDRTNDLHTPASTPAELTIDSYRLPKRIAVDLAAAGVSSLGVSPFITIVDRSIIENASGVRKLGDGLKQLSIAFIKNPFAFMMRREFRIVFGLYSATYATANVIDSICDSEVLNVDNQMPKFIGTTAVNMSLCIAKDRVFAQMFGVGAPTAFPLMSIGLFAIRDSLTVASSFNAPKVVAGHIHKNSEMDHARCLTIAQLACPALVQFASTPLHLLGLDLYNNKTALASDRVKFISREYMKSVFARIGRIGPAFGIGGVGNKFCRDELREQFDLV